MGNIIPPDDPYNYPIVYELPEMMLIKNSHFMHLSPRIRWIQIHSFTIHMEIQMEKFFRVMNEFKLKQLFPNAE